jgi:hypothetical protein
MKRSNLPKKKEEIFAKEFRSSLNMHSLSDNDRNPFFQRSIQTNHKLYTQHNLHVGPIS